MDAPVTCLYPTHEALPLRGLYLNHDLRSHARAERAFVYTNFIASLDGHISEVGSNSGRRRVPAALANGRDWRLYMELLAQCDVMLTTARHLRAVAAGRQRELLSLADAQYADLAGWRAEHGLAPYPVTAVLSQRLDFPSAVVDSLPGGLLALTGADADPDRVGALRNLGIDVQQAKGPMGGRELVDTLTAKGLTSIYSVAGPGIMQTLLAGRSLDRIYLSLVPMLLAGEPFDTLTRGPALQPPTGFKLHAMYLDQEAPPTTGQLLLSFDRAE